MSASHAERAAGFRYCADKADQFVRADARRGRQNLKRQRLQSIRSEDRRSLVEFPVDGRVSPPQVIVVHRRQIVMHERECVNEFDSHRRRIQTGGVKVQALARGIDE